MLNKQLLEQIENSSNLIIIGDMIGYKMEERRGGQGMDGIESLRYTNTCVITGYVMIRNACVNMLQLSADKLPPAQAQNSQNLAT